MVAWLDMLLLNLQLAFRRFITNEEGDVNIVSIVILIGIAILLAVFFRTEIEGLLRKLFGTIEKSATEAITK